MAFKGRIVLADPTDVNLGTTTVGSKKVLDVNILNSGGLFLPSWDYFSVAYPSATQEVYTFKTGGSGGTTVATVTLNYTDSTKEFLSNGAVT